MIGNREDSDPFPFIQIHRTAKHKAVLLAPVLKTTYQHARGSLDEFWELCSDPRVLQRIIETTPAGVEPALVLSADAVLSRFELASGVRVELAPLVAVGILEPQGDAYRVRGMSRQFRTLQNRKARAENGAKGGVKSAERRTSRPSRAPKAGPVAEPSALTVLKNELGRAFLQETGKAYVWQGAKDGVAFAALAKAETADEILARWRAGLRETNWLHVATVAQLRGKWNDLAGSVARTAPTGAITVATEEWT